MLFDVRELCEGIEEDGCMTVLQALNAAECERLRTEIAQIDEARTGSEPTGVRRRKTVYAIRNLQDALPGLRALAATGSPARLAAAILGPDTFPVRSLLFDKTADANWKVIWHQDLTIAVSEKLAVEGFERWSVKAGVIHVQPPAAVMAGLLAVRLHLDDCGPKNGPLQVLPGSHRCGRLSSEEVQRWRRVKSPVACIAPAGSALVMRPLLLHASSAAISPCHRRVIHLEYAAAPLPGGLRWRGDW